MIATGNTFYFSWEVELMTWLQVHLGRAGISFLSFFSVFGEELILIMILGLMYWGFNKQLGKRIGLTVMMGLVWNTMIKNVVLRRRPYFDHEGIDLYRKVEPGADIYDIAAQGYSFPSGHSTNAAGLYGAMAVNEKKKWMTVTAVFLTLMVGISRVAVGAHYPTDVLVGWILGFAGVLVIFAMENHIRSMLLRYAILFLTALPGAFYCRSADYFTGLGLLTGFMAGTLLEEKYVRFENTRSYIRMVLRVLGGLATYLALNALLKLPFSEEFLESGTHGAMLVRTVRYAVIAFVAFGVYPMVFKVTAKIRPSEKEK